jgi:hypothetical protein
MKLTKLTQNQTITPREQHSLYPRIINNTNVTFSNKETILLKKKTQIQFICQKEKMDN